MPHGGISKRSEDLTNQMSSKEADYASLSGVFLAIGFEFGLPKLLDEQGCLLETVN